MYIGIVAQSAATSRQVTSCWNKVFNISQAIFSDEGNYCYKYILLWRGDEKEERQTERENGSLILSAHCSRWI